MQIMCTYDKILINARSNFNVHSIITLCKLNAIMSPVRGKIALVTGGASGIGLAAVQELLKNGLKGATIADVNAENGEAVVLKLSEEYGSGRVIFVKTDVSKEEDVEAVFEKTIATFKNLDIIINSAGICNDKNWAKMIAVNLNGTVQVNLLGLDKYLPKYKSGEEGVIVNVSSVVGLAEYKSLPVYSATKHAIIGLSRSLGVENHYERTKVRVLAICPGSTATALHPGINYVSPHYEKLFEKEPTGQYPRQAAEKVAEGITRAIQEGQNGSVWAVNAGETFEVKLQDLHTILKR